jgi:phage tail sheath gpL-like
MAVKTTVVVTHNKESIGTIKAKFVKAASIPHEQAQQFNNFFAETSGGNRACSFTTQVDSGDAVYATGTFTFTGHSTANDTVVVGGVTFTAEASGATGNQWNIGTTATQTAANLAAAINGSASAAVKGAVTATSVAGVVTVTAIYPGNLGNFYTIAKGTDSGSVCTVSGSTLASGALASTIYTGGPYHSGV